MDTRAPTTSSGPVSAVLAATVDGIQRCRRRLRWAAVARGAAVSLAASLAVACLAEAWRVVGGPPPFDAAVGGAPWSLAVGGAVLLAGLVVSAVAATLTTPGLTATARMVEQRLALDECLSTALEVAARAAATRTRPGPMGEALLNDAARGASLIVPGVVVPAKVPRATAVAPVLLAVWVGLYLAPVVPLMPTSSQAVAVSDASLSADARARAVTEFREMADFLLTEAEQPNREFDPVLKAVAEALKGVSDDLDSGTMDVSQAAAELGRLLRETQEAVAADRRPGLNSQLPGLLQAALDELEPGTGGEDVAPPGSLDRQVADNAIGDPTPTADAAQSSDRPAAKGSLRRLLDDLERRRDQLARRASGELGEMPVEIEDGWIPFAASPQLDARRQIVAGETAESIGASLDAGKGEGDRAGIGTQPLGNAGEQAGVDPDELRQMLLPGQDNPEGRRIRIEVPPKPAFTETADVADASTGAWRPAAPAAVDRQAITFDARDVVGRYFDQPGDGATAGP